MRRVDECVTTLSLKLKMRGTDFAAFRHIVQPTAKEAPTDTAIAKEYLP